MAFGRYQHDLIPFSTPYRARSLYYPPVYRCSPYAYEPCAYDLDDALPYRTHRRRRYDGRDHVSSGKRAISILKDDSLKRTGDLGWTLDYATAWCYAHLNRNQTEVADVLDRALEIDPITRNTPFVIFDLLDRVLFGGKLKSMVYMEWKPMASRSPGTTSAANVVRGIQRVTIELNDWVFLEEYGGIEELLDALIHQMIHAYFLVACGPQTKGEKQDGRLLDGVHFGVILFTIRDISRHCRRLHGDRLRLIFYAKNRQGFHSHKSRRPDFIAFNPRGMITGHGAADNKSHCLYDNQHVHVAQIKNWQMGYTLALDLAMDDRGDTVYDLAVDNKLKPISRLEGPPSASYVELIWSDDGVDKRIMVPRDKTLKHSSLRKPIEKEGKMEFRMPDCSFDDLKLLYDFIVHGATWSAKEHSSPEYGRYQPILAAPILIGHTHEAAELPSGVISHLRLFKIAEAMKFEELQEYVLKKLWSWPSTPENGVGILKQLYDDKADRGPIHSELHKWAREFLKRADDGRDFRGRSTLGWEGVYGSRSSGSGATNYDKLLLWDEENLMRLIWRNKALKADCEVVVRELRGSSNHAWQEGTSWHSPTAYAARALPSIADSVVGTSALMSPLATAYRPALARARSAFSPRLLEGSATYADALLSSLDDDYLPSSLYGGGRRSSRSRSRAARMAAYARPSVDLFDDYFSDY